MTSLQRYVSKELTHFAGRDLKRPDNTPDEDAQYDCLVKILRDGRLLHRRDDPDGPARVAFRGDGSFVERTVIELDAVYFCDIPAEDFSIHIEKYSSFGLSFLKPFLVKQGANPAFYVAANSIVPASDGAAELLFHDRPRPDPLTRGTLMDRMIQGSSGLRAQIDLHCVHRKDRSGGPNSSRDCLDPR